MPWGQCPEHWYISSVRLFDRHRRHGCVLRSAQCALCGVRSVQHSTTLLFSSNEVVQTTQTVDSALWQQVWKYISIFRQHSANQGSAHFSFVHWLFVTLGLSDCGPRIISIFRFFPWHRKKWHALTECTHVIYFTYLEPKFRLLHLTEFWLTSHLAYLSEGVSVWTPLFPEGKGQTNHADACEKFVCPNAAECRIYPLKKAIHNRFLAHKSCSKPLERIVIKLSSLLFTFNWTLARQRLCCALITPSHQSLLVMTHLVPFIRSFTVWI